MDSVAVLAIVLLFSWCVGINSRFALLARSSYSKSSRKRAKRALELEASSRHNLRAPHDLRLKLL